MFCLGAHQEVLRDYSWLGDPLSGGQRLNKRLVKALWKLIKAKTNKQINPYFFLRGGLSVATRKPSR